MWTIPLAEAGGADRTLVGSKAKELGKLMAEGARVPDGFVVTTLAHARATDGLVPAEVATALQRELAARSGPFAFRSSAVAEDLGHASYAGQYETVLNVDGMEEATAALMACWESARSEAVAGYQADHGDTDTRIAVLVQAMVDAEFAGVAFTANPVTGADEVVIEAVPGLGDGLMAGDVTPERWVAAPEPNLASTGELAPVLTPAVASAIAAEALAIAERRGVPQDVEWAVSNDFLHILQTRPITALPVEPAQRPPAGQTWVRDDSYFPDPITPLTFTAWLPYHTQAFGMVTRHLGLPFERIDHGHFLGRVYDRVVPVSEPKKDHPSLPPLPILKLAVRLIPDWRKRLATAEQALAEDRFMEVIDAWENGGREELRANTRALREIERASLSDLQLADHLEDIRRQTLVVAYQHFLAGMAGTFVLAGQLGLVVEEVLGWDPHRVIDLLQGYGEASVLGGVELEQLSDAIRRDPEAAALLREDPRRLTSHPGEGGKAFRSFLERHGHRLMSPRLDTPTWTEDPSPLLHILAASVRHAPEQADPKSIAHAAEAEARAAIDDADDLARFDRALERARKGRPLADDTEPDTGDILAVTRYAALEAGRRLAARGALLDAGDVIYLTMDELEGILRGAQPPEDIGRRKAEHRWALANPAPPIFGPAPSDMPPTEIFPKRTHEVVGAAFWALKMFFTPPHEQVDGAIRGLAASPGRATGAVRIIHSPEEFDRIRAGDIMVCRHTMAAWSPVFPMLSGLVTEQGGPLSHPATLAREYALPAVLAVAGATSLFSDGQIITIDGGRGTIEVDQATNAKTP